MATKRILYVKADPTADYSLGQCIGVFPTSQTMEDGTIALGNGMMLDNVDLDITTAEEESISALGKKVNDVTTPTSIQDI